MNPQQEAFERLGGAYEVRVLEPSPPAVDEEPWFADDPVARGDVPPGRQVVSPVGTGDIRWFDLAQDEPGLAEFCRERWLGPCKRLEPVPPGFDTTRGALHELAEQRISPQRQAANGKIGLRWTRGGFGTPYFGEDRQIRVEGATLIDGDTATRVDGVDEQAAFFIGDLFGFAWSVLEELRAERGVEDRVQLWPEHFDAGLQIPGLAAVGLVPGDGDHAEPYVYVSPWEAPDPGPLWQATGFNGAELSYAELLETEDQRGAALEFLRSRIDALAP